MTPKIDDPAPIYALSSDAFYVGALESKKTHAKRHRGLGVIFGEVDAPQDLCASK